MENIITDIERFLADHKMAESTFGRKTVSDWRLVSQLREGRELRSRTLARIRAFMESYK